MLVICRMRIGAWRKDMEQMRQRRREQMHDTKALGLNPITAGGTVSQYLSNRCRSLATCDKPCTKSLQSTDPAISSPTYCPSDLSHKRVTPSLLLYTRPSHRTFLSSYDKVSATLGAIEAEA